MHMPSVVSHARGDRGCRTVLSPDRRLAVFVMCASFGTTGRRYAGELLSAPPTGEARALLAAEYAAAEGLELTESVAYADSASDRPMFEAVGYPVAVKPETMTKLNWPPLHANGDGPWSSGPSREAAPVPGCS